MFNFDEPIKSDPAKILLPFEADDFGPSINLNQVISLAMIRPAIVISLVYLGVLFSSNTSNLAAADSVEFLDGKVIEGTINEIRKQQKEFDFTAEGQSNTQTYAYSDVHAVTLKGKQFILTRRPGEAISRSRSEVIELIKQAGTIPPDWYASTELNYPPTLDLSWPMKADGGWNNRKNVGQFLWDVINPNPHRWHSGIKLVHHVMERHANNRTLLQRDMSTLGNAYFKLLRDFPRAAFWLQKAGVTASEPNGIYLAECYWRLGNKQLALDALKGRQVHIGAIKLLGEMGQINRATSLADSAGRTNAAHDAFLMAGDVLRSAGKTDEAIKYYEAVLANKNARNKEYLNRFHSRARETIRSIRLQDRADPAKVSDGTYTGSSTGYNGKLTVEVRVANHRIDNIKVTSHKEKQFYAALEQTPTDIIEKQSVSGVDGVSAATITSQAIINATAEALASGAK